MWGEQADGGFFEDVHVLVLVVVGMTVLLASFASAYVAYSEARDRVSLQVAAWDALRALLADETLLHGGETGLFDHIALEGLDGSGLAALLGRALRAQLVVAERSGADPDTYIAETGVLGEARATASTAASVWHGDADVRTARVTLAIGR